MRCGRGAPRQWREAADPELGLHLLGRVAKKSCDRDRILDPCLLQGAFLHQLIRPCGVNLHDVATPILERGYPVRELPEVS